MSAMKLLAARTALAPIAWGTTYVTITETLPADRPVFVAAMRVLPAGLVLVAVAAVLGGPGVRPRGVEWAHTAVVSLCNFVLFFPLLFVAVERLPGGVAASAGGLQPLLVLLISATTGAGRPRRADVVSGVVAALGVGLVVVRPGAGFDAIGVLAAVAANVAFSVGVVVTKRFPAPAHRVAATGWQLLLGGLVLLPLALVIDGAPDTVSARNLAGFAYLSLVGTAIAYVLWFDGIRRLPTVAPPLLGLAAPLTGAALGWAVMGEDLSPLQLLGFALTFGAIAYGAVRSAPPAGAGTSVTGGAPGGGRVRSSRAAQPRATPGLISQGEDR